MHPERPVDVDPVEAAEKRCRVKMRVSIKRGPQAVWEFAKPHDVVVPGEDVEVFAECACRAMIDITPDRVRPVPGIQWAVMVFAPDYSMRTRIKVAYYRPRKIRYPTEVRFRVRVRCRCTDCAGEDETSFPLFFDETQE